MSKKVAIMEGDKSRRFNKVDYLSTRKQGGGHVDWVPEDDRETTTKSITKNGTYKISDEKKTGGGKYYGYSEVTVNVPNSGKAVGKEQDGNTHVVEPDANGDLTDKIIPDSIRITTPPSKLIYTTGETINKSGMVVKAYQGDGSLWEAAGYSGGVIPNSELNLDPSVAPNAEHLDHYDTGGPISVGGVQLEDTVYCVAKVAACRGIGTPHTAADEELYNRMKEGAMFGHSWTTVFGESTEGRTWAVGNDYAKYFTTIRIVRIAICKRGDTNVIVFSADTEGMLGVGHENWSDSHTSYPSSYTYDGKTVWYYTDTSVVVTSADVRISNIEIPGSSDKIKAVAWACWYGTQQTGSDANVTVKWNRPEDYKELTDTFGIKVTGAL